jgi:hypothetical protein
LLHPVVAAGKLSRPGPFQNGPEQLSRNDHFRHREDDLSEMANDLRPILINFSAMLSTSNGGVFAVTPLL